MGSDQVAAIHPEIREVFEAAALGEEWCATFELSSDPDRWVQVTSDSLAFISVLDYVDPDYPVDVELFRLPAG